MKSRTFLPALLGVLAAALLAVGLILWTHPLHHAGHVTRLSDPDPRLTTQVVGQVSTGLNEVLSYSYADPKTNEAAAKKWLTGDAVGQYRTLFAQLQQSAPGQKLTFVAKVVTAGVISADADSAQLLVFVDQKSTRAGTGDSTVSAAQVEIGAVKHGDTWQISELKTL